MVGLLEPDHDRATSLSNIILQATLYMPPYLRSKSYLKGLTSSDQCCIYYISRSPPTVHILNLKVPQIKSLRAVNFAPWYVSNTQTYEDVEVRNLPTQS